MILLCGLKRFPCHRLLLAAASPLLKKILEPFSIEEEVVISLPGYSNEEIKYLFGLVYGDEGYIRPSPKVYPDIVKNLQIGIFEDLKVIFHKPLRIKRREVYLYDKDEDIRNLDDKKNKRRDDAVVDDGVTEPLLHGGDKDTNVKEENTKLHTEFIDSDPETMGRKATRSSRTEEDPETAGRKTTRTLRMDEYPETSGRKSKRTPRTNKDRETPGRNSNRTPRTDEDPETSGRIVTVPLYREHRRFQHQINLRKTKKQTKPAYEENNSPLFPCNICGKYFATRYHFNTHKTSVHPECSVLVDEDEDVETIFPHLDPRLQCSICKQRFDKKSSILRHRINVHARHSRIQDF